MFKFFKVPRQLIISLSLLSVLFNSCSNNSENVAVVDSNKISSVKESKQKNEDVQRKFSNFVLTPFKNLPDTIDGCGDYYLLDTSEIASNKYIFLSRMREIAVVLLNNEITYLNKDTIKSKSMMIKFMMFTQIRAAYKLF